MDFFISGLFHKQLIKLRNAAIVFLFCFSNLTFSQIAITSGNLLRINFTQKNIDFSDTLWQWSNASKPNWYFINRCSNLVRIDTTIYLFTETHEESPSIRWNSSYIYNSRSKISRHLFGDHTDWDVYERFLYFPPVIEKTPEGAVVFNGRRFPAFYLTGDSLINYDSLNGYALIHSAGKIGNKYLVVARDLLTKFDKLFIEDLSTHSNIQLNNPVNVIDPKGYLSWLPIEIRHIEDSLYVIKQDVSEHLLLCSILGNQLRILKRLRPEGDLVTVPYLVYYRFIDKQIYRDENKNLISESWNPVSQNFSNPQVIMSGLGKSYPAKNNILVNVRNDSLIVFDLSARQILNKYDLAGTGYKGSSPIIDSPYVYVHIHKSVTGINDKFAVPNKFNLSQNYPNPFNPETTIKYSIPAVEKPQGRSLHTKLAVYDILGREVIVLVNEDKSPGTYEVIFNARNAERSRSMTSGVYFYKLTCGSLSQTKKFVLMK